MDTRGDKHHGHYKEHSSTDTLRARTKTQKHALALQILWKGAPYPCIARAPELVASGSRSVHVG